MADINILMLGARRTGKSSVLASMINQFEEISKDGSIFIKPDSTTEMLLVSKLLSLKEDFEYCRQKGSSNFMLDERTTANADEYTFNITYRDSKNNMKPLTNVVFRDIPGEDITSPLKINDVKENIKKADVILIAIDTIHLMEENGRYSGFFNRAREIFTVISPSGFIDENSGPKMVLFVPLKCEKYYYQHSMKEVNERIKKEFSQLIAALTTDTVKDRITVGITPILTMGGIEFSHFGTDENGKIKTNNVSRAPRADGSVDQTALRPSEVYFRFNAADSGFSPKYCEQPVLYLLSYIVALAKIKHEAQMQKNSKNRLLRFAIYIITAFVAWPVGLALAASEFFDALSDKNMVDTMKNLNPSFKTSGDGFELLNDPLSLKND